MTEDDAKTKWCPAARVDSTGANRPDTRAAIQNAGFPLCIGSACMAWRITPPHQENVYNSPTAPDGEGWKLGSPTGKGWWRRTVGGPGHGYCGLAGAPQ